MSKQKILILGATGFIGKNAVEYFSANKNFHVIAVKNKRESFNCRNVEWVSADLTNPQDVERVLEGIDIVIQAAATTSGSKDIVLKPYLHVTDNAVMNSYIFRSAYQKKIKHLVFFSCTVMLQSNENELTEKDFDANCEIHEKYFGVGWTKVYLEKMCEFYSRIGETKFTAIRHSNIYGPHDKFDLEKSHVFGATINKVMNAKEKVVVWGDGEEARDLLYVHDLMKMVEMTIQNQKTKFGLYNCGYGEPVTIKNLVEKIISHTSKKLKIEHDLSRPTIKTSLHLDCCKAKSELGWQRETSLDEGIRKTLEWYKNNIKI